MAHVMWSCLASRDRLATHVLCSHVGSIAPRLMLRDSCGVLSCALLQEYRKGGSARAAMAWEWRKRGSMPQGEGRHADVVQMYEEVRAAMELGERLFARGATDKSMQGWHSGWQEAYGLYQVPHMCVQESERERATDQA